MEIFEIFKCAKKCKKKGIENFVDRGGFGTLSSIIFSNLYRRKEEVMIKSK